LQPDVLLHRDSCGDRLILDRPQLSGLDPAGRKVLTCLQQPGGAQQAADMIGAEVGTGACHRDRPSWALTWPNGPGRAVPGSQGAPAMLGPLLSFLRADRTGIPARAAVGADRRTGEYRALADAPLALRHNVAAPLPSVIPMPFAGNLARPASLRLIARTHFGTSPRSPDETMKPC